MGGDHWKSDTGEKVRKTKDPYVRIVYPEEPKPLRTIVGKEELKRDKDLFEFVDKWARTDPRPVGCVWCGKVDTTELVTSPYIYTFEIYNWEKPKTETEFELHRDCVKDSALGIKIESLKMLGKNPTFTPVVTCQVADVCKFFKPTVGASPYNCQNIAVKWGELGRKPLRRNYVQVTFDPVLYCKRGHPGEYKIETESYTAKGVKAFADLIINAKIKAAKDHLAESVTAMLNGNTTGRKMKAIINRDPQIAEAMYVAALGIQKLVKPTLVKAGIKTSSLRKRLR